jgi:hypothetical protein
LRSYRGFLVTSLALAAVAGSSLGLWLLLGWLGRVALSDYPALLSAHGQLQVYGFVTLYTMGVAMMILPTFLRTDLRPLWLIYTCLLTMVIGIGANLQGPSTLGVLCQTLSILGFFGVLRVTRESAPKTGKAKDPLSREHAVFLATGTLWLLVSPALSLIDPTRALETVLWGFAGLYIAGIGLRVHPGMLGIKGLYRGFLLPAAGLWNLALLLRWTGAGTAWAWVLLSSVLLFLHALRPFRRSSISAAGGSWLRYYVRTSYLWLAVAAAMTLLSQTSNPEMAGAARHALGSGFVLTMMAGMGLRMIPAFEVRRLVWAQGPWVVYALLTFGTALRVGAQSVGQVWLMALGGAAQLLAVLGFVILLLGTVWWGKTLRYQPGPEIFESAGPANKAQRNEVSPDERELPLLLR